MLVLRAREEEAALAWCEAVLLGLGGTDRLEFLLSERLGVDPRLLDATGAVDAAAFAVSSGGNTLPAAGLFDNCGVVGCRRASKVESSAARA